MLWLEQAEALAYRRGQRIFEGPTHAVKVMAADAGLAPIEQG
jgi:hypothetical protein